MGILDKFLDVMRLNPDEEDEFFNEDYDDIEEDYEMPAKPAKASRKTKKEKEDEFVDNYKEKTVKTTPSSKVTPIRAVKKQVTDANNMEVCVVKPISMEDAREVTETLLDNRAVILNVEGIDVELAQRIIDFISGCTFAISGNLQKVSNYIFIITPASVDVSGDLSSFADSLEKGF